MPATTLQMSYPRGECPDCGTAIPPTLEGGEGCENCGHVLWENDLPYDLPSWMTEGSGKPAPSSYLDDLQGLARDNGGSWTDYL